MPTKQTKEKSLNAMRRQTAIRDVKRQVIVDGARRAFEKYGLDGASVRLIASEAGCTTGAIYPYFNGKEEIYAAILSESLQALAAHVETSLRHIEAPVKRAQAAVRALYDYYKKNPGDISLGLYLFGGPGVRQAGLTPELNRSLNAQLRGAIGVAVEAVEAAGYRDGAAIVTDGFCHAIGLLIMERTGRLKVLGGFISDPLMQQHLHRLFPE